MFAAVEPDIAALHRQVAEQRPQQLALTGAGEPGKPGGVLLDQPWTSDEKQTVTQALGSAKIVRFAQVLIGK